jgi:hypothetical protein
MVDWCFMFQAMAAMGLSVKFIGMVNLLFQDASATVKINGTPSSAFQINCGVRPGALLHLIFS